MDQESEYNSSSEVISILNEDEEECSPLTDHITEHLLAMSNAEISDDEDEEHEEEMSRNLDESSFSLYSNSPKRRIEEILGTNIKSPYNNRQRSEFSSENLSEYNDDLDETILTPQVRKSQPPQPISYVADDSSSIESLSSLSSYNSDDYSCSRSKFPQNSQVSNNNNLVLNNPILNHPYHSQYPQVTAPSLSLQLGINQFVTNQLQKKNAVQYIQETEHEKETFKTNVENLKKELERKENDFKGSKGENEILKKDIQKLNDKIKHLTEELTNEKKNIIENKNKFTIDLDKKESEIDFLNSTVEKLRIENEKLNQEQGIEKMKHDEELSKMEFMLAELKSELSGLKQYCLETQVQLTDELKKAMEYSNDLSNNIKIQKEELVVMKSINSEIIENLKERNDCLKNYEELVNSKTESLDLRDTYIEEERKRHREELDILMERSRSLEENNESLKDLNQKLAVQIKSQDGAMKNLLSLVKKLETECEDLKQAHKQNIKELTDSFKLMLKESVMKMSAENNANSPELEKSEQMIIELRLVVKKQEEELAKTRKLLQLSKKEIEDQHHRFELYKLELDENSKKRVLEMSQLRSSNSQLLENYLDTERERSVIQIEFNELKLENSRKDHLIKQLEQKVYESNLGMDAMFKENTSLKNQVANIKQQYAEDHFVQTPRTPIRKETSTTPTKSRVITPAQTSVKRPNSASKSTNAYNNYSSSNNYSTSINQMNSSYSSQHQSLRNSGNFGNAVIKPETPRTNFTNHSASNTRMKDSSNSNEDNEITVTTIIPKSSSVNRPGSTGRSGVPTTISSAKRPPSRPNSSSNNSRKSTTPTNSRPLLSSNVGSTRPQPVLKNLTPSRGLFM